MIKIKNWYDSFKDGYTYATEDSMIYILDSGLHGGSSGPKYILENEFNEALKTCTIELSTNHTGGCKKKLYKKGEAPNRFFLNPERILEYDPEKQLIRLRTNYTVDSVFRLEDDAFKEVMEIIGGEDGRTEI